MYQVLFATANGWQSSASSELSDLMPIAIHARDWSLYVYVLDQDDPYAYPWRLIGCSARYFMEN